MKDMTVLMLLHLVLALTVPQGLYEMMGTTSTTSPSGWKLRWVARLLIAASAVLFLLRFVGVI